MLAANAPFVTGRRRVIVPATTRPATAATSLGAYPPAAFVGPLFQVQYIGVATDHGPMFWPLSDTEPNHAMPPVRSARRGIYGSLDSLKLLGCCPLNMPESGGYAYDADGVPGFGYLDQWGKPGSVIRAPRTLVLLDGGSPYLLSPDGAGLGASGLVNADFDAAFSARYASDLKPIGVDVVVSRQMHNFASAVPVTAAVATILEDLDDGLGNTNTCWRVDLTPDDPSRYRGGKVMFAAVGNYGGYRANNWRDTPGGMYVIETDAADGFAPDVTGGVLLASDVTAGVESKLFALPEVALPHATALLAIAARCFRFRFDVYGFAAGTDFSGPNVINPERLSVSVQDVDAVVRQGVPGAAYAYDPTNYAGLAGLIADNAVAFFNS